MNALPRITLLVLVLLGGCSSLESVVEADGSAKDGLVYYMPRRDFMVVITVQTGKPTKVALSTTGSYPDVSTRYVLQYGYNPVGKNTLDVTVTELGLLSSAKSTTESSLTEALKNLAASAGAFAGLRTAAKHRAAPPTCTAEGTYTFIYEDPTPQTPCGVEINFKALATPKAVNHDKTSGVSYSGVFYRQNIPYLMTATADGIANAVIVESPSQSNVYFLPIARTLFSNNAADLGFKDGVPYHYKQEADGDAVALLKLPAEVLGAYFSAVGAAFTNFKTRTDGQTDAMAAQLKLELAKQKYDACILAIKAHDEPRQKELKCGE